MKTLRSDEFPAYYAGYIARLGTYPADIPGILNRQYREFPDFIGSIPEEKGFYRYQDDKWSIKEVIGHINDTERIMAYRALRFARLDNSPLPGFDQDPYVLNARSDERPLESLSREFSAIRQSTLSLLDQFNEDELLRKGIAAENSFTVRALFCIIAGHLQHHWDMLRSHYL